jgi:hypothetical protein
MDDELMDNELTTTVSRSRPPASRSSGVASPALMAFCRFSSENHEKFSAFHLESA